MKRIFLIILLCSMLPVFGNAFGSIPDSLTITWMKGKQYLVHKVEQGDSWDGISKKYGISISTLLAENKDVKELKVNQFVFVPFQNRKPQKKVKVRNVKGGKHISSSGNGDPVIHVVRKGDNLYRISKMYNRSVSDIMGMNNMRSNVVAIGQKLVVGYNKAEVPTEPPAAITAEVTEKEVEEKQEMLVKITKEESVQQDSTFGKLITEESLRNAENPFVGIKATREVEDVKKVTGGKKVKQMKETGVATFILDEDLDQKKFYALHRTAPIGTIVKVLNIMTNQSVFVKVVGRLPDTGDNNNLVIKLSESAAREILARDPYFRVVLSYGEIQ